MALSLERIASIIESMLLVLPDPLPVARILEVIQGEDPETDADQVRSALDWLIEAYGNPERPVARGFRVEDVGGGVQLRTTPENSAFLRRLLSARPQRLTKPALETLAIIAYRQPVTKTEIESIRGVDVGAVLKALLDRDVIQIIGKKEEVGRPLLYGTTRKFLEMFGLRSLQALPTLREYHELDEQHQKAVDELYEVEKTAAPLSELLQAADFLMRREHDPDIDELDEAVRLAEQTDRATAAALAGPQQPAPDGQAPAAPAAAPDAAPAAAPGVAPASPEAASPPAAATAQAPSEAVEPPAPDAAGAAAPVPDAPPAEEPAPPAPKKGRGRRARGQSETRGAPEGEAVPAAAFESPPAAESAHGAEGAPSAEGAGVETPADESAAPESAPEAAPSDGSGEDGRGTKRRRGHKKHKPAEETP